MIRKPQFLLQGQCRLVRGVDILHLDFDARHLVVHTKGFLRGGEGDEPQVGIVFIHTGFKNTHDFKHLDLGDQTQRSHPRHRGDHGNHVALPGSQTSGQFFPQDNSVRGDVFP